MIEKNKTVPPYKIYKYMSLTHICNKYGKWKENITLLDSKFLRNLVAIFLLISISSFFAYYFFSISDTTESLIALAVAFTCIIFLLVNFIFAKRIFITNDKLIIRNLLFVRHIIPFVQLKITFSLGIGGYKQGPMDVNIYYDEKLVKFGLSKKFFLSFSLKYNKLIDESCYKKVNFCDKSIYDYFFAGVLNEVLGKSEEEYLKYIEEEKEIIWK